MVEDPAIETIVIKNRTYHKSNSVESEERIAGEENYMPMSEQTKM